MSVSRSAPGLQSPPRRVERIVLRPRCPQVGQLDPAPAILEGVAGPEDHMERVHDRDGVGHFLDSGGCESGKAFRGNDLHGVARGSRTLSEPVFERSFGAAFDHVEQPSRARSCSSTPITITASNRSGSAIGTCWPSASTALLAVFHDTARPSATRATLKRWHIRASSAHRRPRRDSLARGSAAFVLSRRHT